MRTSLLLPWMVAAAACGGQRTQGTAVVPAPAPTPTSFEGATRTWQVNHQFDDVCTIVDTAVCADGDVTACEAAKTAPYPCPAEGIATSAPWNVYQLGEGCWLHGEPPQCDDHGCAPPVTRSVVCPP